MKTDFIYYGLKISSEDYNLLTKILRSNNSTNEVLLNCDKIFLHHTTLLFHTDLNDETFKLKEYYDREDGKIVPIKITDIGMSDKAMAFKVSLKGFPCAKENTHITICTMNGGKPVDSNYITKWKPVLPLVINTELFCFRGSRN